MHFLRKRKNVEKSNFPLDEKLKDYSGFEPQK